MRLLVSLMSILMSFMSSAQVIIGPTTGQNGATPKALLDVRASDPADPSKTDGFLLPRLEYFPDADQVLQGIQEGTLMIYMPGPDVTPEEGRVIGGVYVYTELEAWELLSLSGDGIDDDGDAPCVVIQNNTGTNVLSCSTPEITLTASGAGPHSWNTGATTSSITVTTPETYTVNLDDCNSSASIVITGSSEDGAPTAEITSSTTELTSEFPEIVVVASGGDSYSWNTGETTAQLTITEADTYTVTVTYASNGCTDTESVVITEEVACGGTIHEAGFENGYDGWIFYSNSTRSSQQSSQGQWSARIDGYWENDGLIDKSVDFSNYTSVTISFKYRTSGYDSNGANSDFFELWFYGNGGWTRIESFYESNNGWDTVNVFYNGSNINDITLIDFSGYADVGEYVYIDEIVITATCN